MAIKLLVPVLRVADVARSIDWYRAAKEIQRALDRRDATSSIEGMIAMSCRLDHR